MYTWRYILSLYFFIGIKASLCEAPLRKCAAQQLCSCGKISSSSSRSGCRAAGRIWMLQMMIQMDGGEQAAGGSAMHRGGQEWMMMRRSRRRWKIAARQGRLVATGALTVYIIGEWVELIMKC
jgi:hypothetical protein